MDSRKFPAKHRNIPEITNQQLQDTWKKHNGRLPEISRELGISGKIALAMLKKLNLLKPLAGGSIDGLSTKTAKLPRKNHLTRYICTSAQNNTYINEAVWDNLKALAKHYKARILVSTFSYNQNAYGQMSVKRNTAKHDTKLWYDERLTPFFADYRMVLAPSLVWCGESNILPTASDPLDGFETYTDRKSAIFPHAKLAMRSIPAIKGEGTKFNYTTGTVTQKNYIQKKAGLKGESHHSYGALLVEIDSNGNWWTRQLEADDDGTIYDLDRRVKNGRVTTGHEIEAITWGDLHATCIDPVVHDLATRPGGMIDTLKPHVQFVHDLIEGASVNHHSINNPHDRFRVFSRGLCSVSNELKLSADVLKSYCRENVKTVVVDSNHDQWLARWLREHDYRTDPENAILFLELQQATFRAIHDKDESFNVFEYAMDRFLGESVVKFLSVDESFKICGNRIECGIHGHLGTDGTRGTPSNLCKIARPANTAHTHSTGIWNQLYVAGTSSKLDMGYNVGPSSWSHSHIITYRNGKRAIITIYAGKWRA